MIADHRQADILDDPFGAIDPFANDDVKGALADFGAHIDGTHIGLRGKIQR